MPITPADRAALNYLDEGHGPAIVLLHAFPLSGEMWGAQVEALSPRWRVIAPDLPGFGGSAVPDDPRTHTVAAMADAVAGLLDCLGTGPAAVAGLSMGGYVTFELLRRRPDLVSAVILADTRASADAPGVADRRSAQIRQIGSGDVAGVLEGLLGGLLGRTTREERPDVVARVRALMEATPAEGMVAALEAMRTRTDSTPALSSMPWPALVVVGEEDALSPPAVAREMAGAIPGARLVEIAGAGHLTAVEAPEEFSCAVEAFLAALEARE